MLEQREQFKTGDVIALGGHGAGEPIRLGEILEVLGAGDHTRYRVFWDDEKESILYPAAGARIHVRRTPVGAHA